MTAHDAHTDYAVERVYRQKDAIVAGLRELADAVDRCKPRANPKAMEPNYGDLAYDVQHAITWGLANLHLDGFARNCAEVDVLVAYGEIEALKDEVMELTNELVALQEDEGEDD